LVFEGAGVRDASALLTKRLILMSCANVSLTSGREKLVGTFRAKTPASQNSVGGLQMKAVVPTTFLLMYAFMVVLLFAADTPVDGKWEAKVKTQVGEQTIRLNLKTEGNKLTGTVVSGQGSETAIQDGKVEGPTLSFKQSVDVGGSSIDFLYTGKLNGDQIAFTREPFTLEFVARRVK